MTVSFSVARRDEVVDRNCCICLESFEDAKLGEIVVHDGSLGNLHPMHKECIRKWMNGPSLSAVCPMCKGKVDKSSLFSWKERLSIRLREISISPTVIALGAPVGGVTVAKISVVAVRALGPGTGAGVIYGGCGGFGGMVVFLTADRLMRRFPILLGNNPELLRIIPVTIAGVAGAAFGGFMGSQVGGDGAGVLAGLATALGAVYCLRRIDG